MKQEVNRLFPRTRPFCLLSEGHFSIGRMTFVCQALFVVVSAVVSGVPARDANLPRSLIFGFGTIKNVAHAPIRDSLKEVHEDF